MKACFVLVMMMLSSLASAAPVLPAFFRYPVLRMDKPPAPFEGSFKGDWAAAQLVESFRSCGKLEPQSQQTSMAMIFHKDRLYVAARCRAADVNAAVRPTPGLLRWDAEHIELVFSAQAPAAYPLMQVNVYPDGRLEIHRWNLHSPGSGISTDELLDSSIAAIRCGKDDSAWWAQIELPLDKLGVPSKGFLANAMRCHQRICWSWREIWGGAFRELETMGPAVPVDKLPDWPQLALPLELGVGLNELHLQGRRQGCTLLADGRAIAVAEDGKASLEVPWHGHVEMDIAEPDGTVVARYTCDVPRPLLLRVKPSQNKGHQSVEVSLATAGGQNREVLVQAYQMGKVIAQTQVQAGPGKTDVDLACNASAGEVQVTATASVPGTKGPIPLVARHWCLVDQPLPPFRDGAGELPTRSMIRACVADAGNSLRLRQTYDGWFADVPQVVQQGAVYTMAVLYTADWKENPYRGDKRFLHAAIAGMEATLQPPAPGMWWSRPDNRTLQALLLSYDLIKDDVPKPQAAAWERVLKRAIESTIEVFLDPAEYQLNCYSDNFGIGTNHWAFHVANVYTAGKIFGREDWRELGRRHMYQLMRHAQDGNFPERREMPTPSYSQLTQCGLGQYAFQSGDEMAREACIRCVNNTCELISNGNRLLTVFDGRVNTEPGYFDWLLPNSMTERGRRVIRNQAQLLLSGSPQRISGESLFRLTEAAVWYEDGPEADPPTNGFYSFMDARGVVVRKNGFVYGLSVMYSPAMDDLFRLDAQNAIELTHHTAGVVLRGNNSQDQPEAGSFSRGPGKECDFLPIGGAIQRLADGELTLRQYKSFDARIFTRVLSPELMEIKVQAQDRPPATLTRTIAASEPIEFDFFPGGEIDKVRLDGDGRSIEWPGVKIETSSPVQLQKDLKIFNPYSTRHELRVKPLRAHVRIEPDKPFTLRIRIQPPAAPLAQSRDTR